MGGNAIKKNGKSICGRLNKIDYEKIKSHVIQLLAQNHIYCEVVMEVPGKESFGDMDIMYIPTNTICDMKKFLMDKLNISEVKHVVTNGYVMSCAFDCAPFGIEQYFQLDFLNMGTYEHIEMGRFYFSYGDIGSILGRICNYWGLKF